MKQNPCPVSGCQSNISPTSKHKVCARCEQVIQVIEYLVKQEKAEAERVAKRKATGLITPDEIRQKRKR